LLLPKKPKIVANISGYTKYEVLENGCGALAVSKGKVTYCFQAFPNQLVS